MDPSGICRTEICRLRFFDYGRNYGVMYDIEGWTDMLLNLAVTLIPMQTTL